MTTTINTVSVGPVIDGDFADYASGVATSRSIQLKLYNDSESGYQVLPAPTPADLFKDSIDPQLDTYMTRLLSHVDIGNGNGSLVDPSELSVVMSKQAVGAYRGAAGRLESLIDELRTEMVSTIKESQQTHDWNTVTRLNAVIVAASLCKSDMAPELLSLLGSVHEDSRVADHDKDADDLVKTVMKLHHRLYNEADSRFTPVIFKQDGTTAGRRFQSQLPIQILDQMRADSQQASGRLAWACSTESQGHTPTNNKILGAPMRRAARVQPASDSGTVTALTACLRGTSRHQASLVEIVATRPTSLTPDVSVHDKTPSTSATLNSLNQPPNPANQKPRTSAKHKRRVNTALPDVRPSESTKAPNDSSSNPSGAFGARSTATSMDDHRSESRAASRLATLDLNTHSNSEAGAPEDSAHETTRFGGTTGEDQSFATMPNHQLDTDQTRSGAGAPVAQPFNTAEVIEFLGRDYHLGTSETYKLKEPPTSASTARRQRK